MATQRSSIAHVCPKNCIHRIRAIPSLLSPSGKLEQGGQERVFASNDPRFAKSAHLVLFSKGTSPLLPVWCAQDKEERAFMPALGPHGDSRVGVRSSTRLSVFHHAVNFGTVGMSIGHDRAVGC